MKMLSIRCMRIVCLGFFLLIGSFLQAQAQAQDPFQQHVYPPELVMEHQSILNLTDQQSEDLIQEVQDKQAAFTGLNWKLRKEMDALVEIIKQAQPKEDLASAQMQKVLKLENEIKLLQIQLMVRIKNILTAEQMRILDGKR